MSDDHNILALLPARLKNARTAQGLSLDALARLSGVSRSMVSQIERGESSPTISTLWNLTRALGIDVAALFEDESEDRIEVMRADAVPVIDSMGEGCRIRILSAPEDAGTHELYEIRLNDGGALVSEAHGRGAREQVTVVGGSVEIRAGDLSARLEKGDTARYAADQPHAIRAAGSQGAKVILLVTGA